MVDVPLKRSWVQRLYRVMGGRPKKRPPSPSWIVDGIYGVVDNIDQIRHLRRLLRSAEMASVTLLDAEITMVRYIRRTYNSEYKNYSDHELIEAARDTHSILANAERSRKPKSW